VDRRAQTWNLLQPTSSQTKAGTIVDVVVAATIVVAVVSFVLESMRSLAAYKPVFTVIEVATLVVFVPEYLLRLWSCVADPRYRGAMGRLRWAASPAAVIDLLAIVPSIVSAGVLDLRVLRGLRLLRLFRLGRYSRGFGIFVQVLRESRQQLVIALTAVLMVLLISSSILYMVEREAQPVAFGSVPAAMWWGVATLTTVGYGDVTPATDLGRVLASVIAMLGIGTFALPAGIIAGAFERVLHQEQAAAIECPACGAAIEVDRAPRRGPGRVHVTAHPSASA